MQGVYDSDVQFVFVFPPSSAQGEVTCSSNCLLDVTQCIVNKKLSKVRWYKKENITFV